MKSDNKASDPVDVIDLDPLATYINPSSEGLGDDTDRDWTPELTKLVSQYLKDLPDDWYATLLNELLTGGVHFPKGTQQRDQQVARIIAQCRLRDIGRAAHYMVVKSAPSLDLLIDSIFAMRRKRKYRDWTDIGEWMDANVTADQRLAYLHELDPTLPQTPRVSQESAAVYVTDWIEWRYFNGRLPSLLRMGQAWKDIHAQSSQGNIRTWAKNHGYEVGERGRLPKNVLAAYQSRSN